MTYNVAQNEWYYSLEHGELCRVIEILTLWGETVCRVWLRGKDTTVRLHSRPT